MTGKKVVFLKSKKKKEQEKNYSYELCTRKYVIVFPTKRNFKRNEENKKMYRLRSSLGREMFKYFNFYSISPRIRCL